MSDQRSMSGPKRAMSTAISRRHALATGAAALSAPFIARPAFAASRNLRILCWEGYAEPEWLDPFKEEFDASVSISYAGSVDEMFAKMQGSQGADFDLISVDTSGFDRYIGAGLIAPLDLAKIPNAANLSPAFQNLPAIMRDSTQYGIPFAWGSLPLVYDKAQFDSAPESWEVMWNPDNAGKLIAMDDANNSVTLAAMVLGLENPFKLSDAEFDMVKEKLIAQKRLLLTYFAGFDEGVNIFANSGVKAMFSMGEPQVAGLRDLGVDAAMTIPSEGAIGWLDCWEISAGAEDVELAYAWINACLANEVGAILSNDKSYGNAVNEEANTRNGFTYADKLVFLKAPEDFDKRVTVWNEVKAAL